MRAVMATLVGLIFAAHAPAADPWGDLARQRADYRTALDQVRQAHGGVRKLPVVDFFLFGMGGRTKYLYTTGELRDGLTGKVVRSWPVAEELIVPPSYAVALKTTAGKLVVVREDEVGVWVEEDGRRESLTESPVKLPEFTGHPHRLVLRVLHQELLVNVVGGKPLPNYFVYAKPWHRDGAMMAMAFARTGNVGVLKEWILGLRDPFDRNNKGEAEADNPGQVLYLVSLVSDRSHPVVPPTLAALKGFETGNHIRGRSDFAPHPVYQTRWAKFGLAALKLPDPYTVPAVADSYGPLFWWDKAGGVPGEKVTASADYPYLTWAGSHSTGQKLGRLADRDYPLTWEAKASEADYAGMARVHRAYAEQKLCAPHTWHAAEAFLYLLDAKE